MVAEISAYEECRQKRMEENKKRMEVLNLHKLSQDLKNSSTKPSPSKRAKTRVVEKQVVVVRRSSRVANQPAPFYKEVVIDRVVIPRRISKARDLSNRVYATDEARAKAMEKAEKLQSDLGSDCPIFIKSMLQSHVTGGFWLGLPVDFCRRNLPRRDDVITLIDEDAHEYQVIYLARKNGLSGGWKGFAVAHGLVDGDAVVFQLIKSTAFKVVADCLAAHVAGIFGPCPRGKGKLARMPLEYLRPMGPLITCKDWCKGLLGCLEVFRTTCSRIRDKLAPRISGSSKRMSKD
ncbi:unnamed protein product [Dovyalis caffra]|uniref:TF-B3 domain-containing protein n=1 Tax=Dovyalis caffra TaxID=77055 RepID=A0AAV1S9M8_9ROSI|nr:unnamed protein product [Dovyalis caffra]